MNKKLKFNNSIINKSILNYHLLKIVNFNYKNYKNNGSY